MLSFDEATHTYTVDGTILPSVTEICSILRNRSDISAQVLQQAARRGTRVHELTQLIDYGCDPDELEIEPELVGYIKAYLAFLHDFHPEWQMIEHKLGDLELGYAGTIDRFGKVGALDAVVDIKTTERPTRADRVSWACQLAAYLDLIGKAYPNRINLLLSKDGTYRLIHAEETERKYKFDSFALFTELKKIHKITHSERSKPKHG